MNQIADRAELLKASMSQGQACYMACREAGIPEAEVPSTAEIVSTMLLNRESAANAKALANMPAEAVAAQKKTELDAALKNAAALRANAEMPGKANREKRAARITELLNTPAWVAAQTERLAK